MAMDLKEIEKYIKEAMPDASVNIQDLAGDGNHYSATVTSSQFAGKSKIEQHKMVYNSLKGKKIAKNVTGYVVPGSGLVKKQAEDEGLDKIFTEFGLEWRNAGCSMCLGMNPDQLKPQERCASTSNRNFEGRQGRGGRTHLVSPGMAIAAAINGHLTDVREI